LKFGAVGLPSAPCVARPSVKLTGFVDTGTFVFKEPTMGKTRPPDAPEFRQQRIELVRAAIRPCARDGRPGTDRQPPRFRPPTQTYSKGVLIQAKKEAPSDSWSTASHTRLVGQCNTMLGVTAAAFVFNYAEGGIRCGAATRVAGAKIVTNPSYLCHWTPYRFFLQLFRCFIGDPRITSANVEDLPVPYVLRLDFTGGLSIERTSRL
jgi:hypothetical protein